jgi:hypothetical protein
MKLTDKELVVFSKNIKKMPFINMTKENVEVLQTMANEILELRKIKEVTIRNLLININNDIAEGEDEKIWDMNIEEYLTKPSKYIN